MLRLIWLLSTQNGRRALFWLFIIGVLYIIGNLIYESINPPPKYMKPSGKIVTTMCITNGIDCDEYGYVRLWTDFSKTDSNFVRSPQAPFCVATKSGEYLGGKFWWIDCGLTHGNQLPVIEGWVSEKNLKFSGGSIP